MNKLAILSILAICLALAAGKRGNKVGGKVARSNRTRTKDILSEPGLPSRRTQVVQSAQRVIDSENAAQESEGSAVAASRTSLQAGERNLDALQALLQTKIARQERLDAKAERKARRKDAAKFATGERLQAENSVDYEAYVKAEDFNDLSAAANLDIQNQFGLSVQSQNSFIENAAISESSGSKFDAGTRYSIDEAVDAAAYVNDEAVFEDEFADDQLISADLNELDALNAQEEIRFEDQVFINAQDQQQVGTNFRADDFISSFDDFFKK